MMSRQSSTYCSRVSRGRRQAFSAQEITTPTDDNRTVGWPYTKRMVSNPDVNMASAAIVCSVERARELGVPSDRWVFVHAGADGKDRSMSERRDFHSSPAIGIAGSRALELAGVGIDDVAHLDLYSCYPSAVQLAIAVNAIPIIAFAPVANNWFGILSPLSKMAIAATLVYFPIMINVLRGLTQVEGSALELMRSYAAGPAAVTTQLRVPNALPYFLTGLKIATTLSLIGAVVGEYFGGLSATLGRVVVSAASALRFDVTWAAILVVSLTGIVMYLAVVALERVLIPWHPSLRGDRMA